jgi:hypothetical protein
MPWLVGRLNLSTIQGLIVMGQAEADVDGEENAKVGRLL